MAEAVDAQSTSVRPVRKQRYIPRKRRHAPRRTEAGGTRGCSRNVQGADIRLLVPQNGVGHTNHDRPTFSWYIDNPAGKELPLQFALIEPGELKPVYQTQLVAQQSGVMQLTLPDNVPGLKADRAYRWMVSWSCDRQRPSEQLHRRAWIERTDADAVADSIGSASSDTTAPTISDRITTYARSGLWYEAIDLAAKQRQTAQGQTIWQQLLEDGQLPPLP